MFFFGVNDQPEFSFEIPYPLAIPETSIISEMFILENFCGKLSGLLIFSEPVDVAEFRKYSKKHPNFMTVSRDLQDIQTSFQDYLVSCFLCLSPINRRWQENSQPLVCPLTNKKINLSPSIIISHERENVFALVESLDLLLLIGQTLRKLSASERDTSFEMNTDERNKEIEDAFVEYLKFLMKHLEADRTNEDIVESNQLIQKYRACVEASGLKITERTMKYFINLVRCFKNPLLVAQAFNDLILNPYLLAKSTAKARELYQEFLIVYYPQLISMSQFQKYLAKRILLVEVQSCD